ncbi:MAG: hypothetical protein ACJ75J_08435 [Cytophagaceae bacterium]
MEQSIPQLIESRKGKLYYYSPVNFIRQIKEEKLVQIEIGKIKDWDGISTDHRIITISVQDFSIHFYLRFLSWDTGFFSLQTFRLHYVLYDCSFEILQEACCRLNEELRNLGAEYVFIEIPSEDIILIQALTASGFKLTETRLTYFNSALDSYSYERFDVRRAREEDIAGLRTVASVMRNDYDRFHADAVFSKEIADLFLARYVEEAIKGFCDIVLVPGAQNVKVDSFLTANYNKTLWKEIGFPVSKMVLSTVSSATNRGWYVKLISEMTYHLREAGAQAIYMSTQSTNRAVIKTWEKLKYNYGASTHILSNSYNRKA